MALCRTCQRDAGWLSHECADCRRQRETAEAAKLVAEQEAGARERQATIDSMVDPAVSGVKAAANPGGTVHLYDTLVVDLNEDGIGRRGLDRLRELGERGWEVVSTAAHVDVSRNFDGAVSQIKLDRAQMLLDLAVSASTLDRLDPEIRRYYAARAVEELDATR